MMLCVRATLGRRAVGKRRLRGGSGRLQLEGNNFIRPGGSGLSETLRRTWPIII
jgi:hypothetical protein